MTRQQEIGKRLAQLRRMKSVALARDIRQPELAALCKVEPETYSRWENGKRGVPDNAIEALAKFYGVTPGSIRYGEPSVSGAEPSGQPEVPPQIRPLVQAAGGAIRVHDGDAARALHAKKTAAAKKGAGRHGPKRRPG